MCWLILSKNLYNTWPIAQVALHKAQVRQFGKECVLCSRAAANYVPTLFLKKLDEVRPDKASRAGD